MLTPLVRQPLGHTEKRQTWQGTYACVQRSDQHTNRDWPWPLPFKGTPSANSLTAVIEVIVLNAVAQDTWQDNVKQEILKIRDRINPLSYAVSARGDIILPTSAGPKQISMADHSFTLRETGTGASPRPPDPNKFLGRCKLFQQTIHFRPLQSDSRKHRTGPLFHHPHSINSRDGGTDLAYWNLWRFTSKHLCNTHRS